MQLEQNIERPDSKTPLVENEVLNNIDLMTSVSNKEALKKITYYYLTEEK